MLLTKGNLLSFAKDLEDNKIFGSKGLEKFLQDHASIPVVVTIKRSMNKTYACGDTYEDDTVSYKDQLFVVSKKAEPDEQVSIDDLEGVTYRVMDGYATKTQVMMVLWYTYTTKIDTMCSECEQFYDENQQYKDGHVDNLFNTMVLAHGVATGFTGEVDVEEVKQRMIDLMKHNDWQICCSNKSHRIGAAGVYLMGHNYYISAQDLNSKVNSRGHRVFNTSYITLYTDIERYNAYLLRNEHSEHIVSDYKILGFWAKDWALENMTGLKEAMEQLRASYRTTYGNEPVYHIIHEDEYDSIF